MNNMCTGKCSPHFEKQRCSGQLRLPQTPVEARKWNSDAEKKNDSHYKFQCNYEERRRRTDARRKKLVHKLKFEHRINVDELSSRVLENILLQAEMLEKQKRMREKDKIQRRLHFINKLVQEEKYKCRDAKSLPTLPKKIHKMKQSNTVDGYSNQADECENLDLSLNAEVEGSTASDVEIQVAEDAKTTVTEESESDDSICDAKQLQESLLPLEFFASRKETLIILSTDLIETYLKCIPDSIVFENCKPNKTYTRTYRISNVGFDDVHCRYAGIMTERNEGIRFQVEMTDSVLLRPGLSFVGKVKMVSSAEVAELTGLMIYETRRKKNPNKKTWFRIPFKCLPVRSIVEISPSVIRFPSINWCTATGKERLKHLRKTIKIRNSGGKDCSCCIVNSEKWKGCSTTSRTWVREEESANLCFFFDSNDEEFDGESYYFLGANEEALKIMSELLDNVFEVFRFSRKYHIPLPAMSTVNVDLDFLPEYRGYHHEVAFIRFEGADNCIEEKLEMSGEIKKVPLRVEPLTIDLKICIISGGLYEGTFRVYNEGNAPITVHLKVPGSMKQHSLVYPRESVIQPRSYQICSVRLFPRPSISKDAFRYYNEETKVLEFPVFIHPLGKNMCKWDRIKLYVFAVITDQDLELQPSQVDFGLVTTLETIRTEISLINYSMCPQEFGFLHLPKGVRIEPNYGFGCILPKETIRLYLLYSPVLKCVNNRTEEGACTFRIEVTSLTKLSTFSKYLQESPESESTDTICGEEPLYNTETDETPRENLSLKNSQVNEEEEEEEDEERVSLIDDGDKLRVLQNKQEKIREYLSQNVDLFPDLASTENASTDGKEFRGENEDSFSRNSLRDDKCTLTCKAVVIKPFCELSSTVIQLPATPMSSTSVTRFRINTNPPESCSCNFMGRASKKNGEFFSEAFFEFHTPSTMIKIEPQSGHTIRGQSLAVAIIFRPEFSKDELIHRSRVLKAESLSEEAKSKNVPPSLKSKSRTNTTKPTGEASGNQSMEIECQHGNLTDLELTQYDLFAGERALERMIEPFHLEFEVICIMKILPCQGPPERMEYHSLKLIAPVIKPSCVFLGNCQEISFGKVAVGDSSRKIIHIQNISLNRISPRISALNPHGPFTCTTCSKMDKIDPEHIWRHPITFSPTAERGKESEFFEVRHGVTSIRLTVNGEGVMPKYTFSPDFALCLVETPVDVITEAEFVIENMCEAELKFQFVLDFIKKRSNTRDESALFESNGSQKSDVTLKKPERKIAKDGTKKITFKNELIPELSSQLETEFENIQNPPNELFTILGLDKKNEVLIKAFGKCLLKVRFSPVKEIISNKKGESPPLAITYAVGYKIMLLRAIVKNLVIIGTIQSNK